MVGRTLLTGAVVAVGAMMLVPGVAAAVAKAARPVVRRAGTVGARAYEDLRRAGAEAYEHAEDLAAEIRADLAAGRDAAEATERPADDHDRTEAARDADHTAGRTKTG